MRARRSYDIAMLADPRFPGGTSTAVASDLTAAVNAGYRCALLPVKAPVLRFPHPFHPDFRPLIDAGQVDVVDATEPLDCGLLLIQHPQIFDNLPQRPLRIHADQCLLIVHHPPFDGRGHPYYDPCAIHDNATLALGRAPLWAPISAVVRRQFEVMDVAVPLHDADWHNVIDPARWRVDRADFVDRRCCIGRHSRPDPMKWPATREEVLEAYPSDIRFLVRILGGGAFLDTLLDGDIPANWRVKLFASDGPRPFLAGIDFFIYYHHPDWVEAFGRVVLEAMAAGCVAILPAYMKATFGEAAFYAVRSEAPGLALELLDSPDRVREQRVRAHELVRDHFSLEACGQRFASLLGRPRRAPPAASARRSRHILFITSNGIGMGHLSRLLAIARRLPDDLTPVFLTMSQGMRVIELFGYLAEYTPFHGYIEADNQRWNHFLRHELREILAFYDPAVAVFDGNVPYGGMIHALQEREDLWTVWVRRGFWRNGTGDSAIAREAAFDAVVEPDDLAGALDNGPTRDSRARTVTVDPVRLVDETEIQSRAQACSALALDPDAVNVLINLGAGNNFKFDTLYDRFAICLGRRERVTPVVVQSPIAEDPLPATGAIRAVQLYPLAPYLEAFDLVISTAGYNAFHELLLAGRPTLFVPNEHPMMDEQLVRARWAERAGLARCLRTRDLYKVGAMIDEMLDPDVRADIHARLRRLSRRNGAYEAARLIGEMACTVRADRPRG